MAQNNASGRLDSSRVLSIMEQFEQAWRNGGRPDLALFLPADAAGLEVLLPLVHIDLEQRLKVGERARVEDYLLRFPVLGEDDHAVWQLIEAEYQLRRLREPDLQWDEYGHRFPRFGPTQMDSPPSQSVHPAVALLVSIPGYDIQGILGRGGMGIVYRAHHRQLDRPVALKMIKTGPDASPEELELFQSEARAVARLQHPHIVQIFEVGQSAGQPFFSLEYVPGGSLADRLNATPQPPHDSARLVETLARAIEHAHQHGIVHRDLKPHNVLLTATGDPKITDFGLAKWLDREGDTVSGVPMGGTPSYMAPEQAAGRTREIGPATDVWALGTILYEMLTGRPPFKGTSRWDTLEQVQHTEPAAPSQVQPGIPWDIETICLKCLQKEPARRYASALELADDLRRFLNGEPIRARRTGPVEHLVKWVRRKPFQAALAGALLLVLAATSFAGVAYTRYLQSELNALRTIYHRLSRVKQLREERRWSDARIDVETAIKNLKTQFPSQASGLLAELEENRLVIEQHLQAQQERLAPFLKARDRVVFEQVPLSNPNWARTSERVKACIQETLALYVPDGGEDLASRLTEALNRDRQLLTQEEFAQLTSGWYELLLIWAEAEAGPAEGAVGVPALAGLRDLEDRLKPGLQRPAQLREQNCWRGERALALLDQAALLGEAYELKTQVIYQHRARYLAQSWGEPFDPSRLDPAAPPKPSGAVDWFLQALDRYQAGLTGPDLQTALAQVSEACRAVLVLEKDHFWAHYLSGLCQLRAGRWREARVDFTACLKLRQDFPWPLLLRGFAASGLGMPTSRVRRPGGTGRATRPGRW